MLSSTHILAMELGTECNLAHKHPKCPSNNPLRWANLNTERKLDDATILACARDAYLRFNFRGHIVWSYYSEPTLYGERMLALMDAIEREIPIAKFEMTTNGTKEKWINEHRYRFAWSFVSPYATDPAGDNLDDRLECPRREPSDHRCGRPLLEFILDAYGNHHPCCYDWQGKTSLGNVFVDGFATIVERWRNFQNILCGEKMQSGAPDYCRRCDSHFRYE